MFYCLSVEKVIENPEVVKTEKEEQCFYQNVWCVIVN